MMDSHQDLPSSETHSWNPELFSSILPAEAFAFALPLECQGKPIPLLHIISKHRAQLQLQLLPALSGTLFCRAESQNPLLFLCA